MFPHVNEVADRAAKIDRLLNRLLKETTRLLHTRAEFVVTLQSSEVEAGLQSKKVDWVMEFSSFRVASEWTMPSLSTYWYPESRAVMRVLLGVKSGVSFYYKYFGCGDRPESKWTDKEAFWAAMDQCAESIAQQIVDEVFAVSKHSP